MPEKIFHIYRSSAGSGKTRTLAKEYLKLALRYRADYFKHILAVTFTNKATQEMKDRILDYLNAFANGTSDDLAGELRSELKMDAATFQHNAQEVQASLLHGYAHFAISTIDAFFQKVIRSFTREAGLTGDYRLEVDQDPVLEEVVDNLIDELGGNEELTRWVVEFAQSNLENERAWDVRSSLIEFSKELFKEEFKLVENQVISHASQRDFFKNLLTDLRKKKYEFIHTIRNISGEALSIIQSSGFHESDFKYGSRGSGVSFFLKMNRIDNVSDADDTGIGKRPRGEFHDPKSWPSKDSLHYKNLMKVAEDQLIPLLHKLLAFRDKEFREALSVEVVMREFYSFGLLADISRKLREYKEENNLMLLADAPAFLNGVIGESDTPFIYEKVGSFYRNYLIDEFQDTSGYQWKNLYPLVTNGLDQGYPSMVVGDVKQAIYRWRGGDMQLLQDQVEQVIGSHRVMVRQLTSNFRSANELVEFNNLFFESATKLITDLTGGDHAEKAYLDVAQKPEKSGAKGIVKINFIQEEATRWKDDALTKLILHLEEIQQSGVPLRDIAILVRKNEEGERIVAHLLAHKHSAQAKPGCRYDVISNESLRLTGASTVNLLLAALHYLSNPENAIARAQLGFEYAKLHNRSKNLTEVFEVSNQVFFESSLPDSFSRSKVSLRKLPLFELTETLIEIFKLGNVTGELAYLQAFQELVLEFSGREKNDLDSFLKWWADHGNKKSIQVSGDVDAIQIITIHKSKGLQFPYVIIPFCSWSLDHEYGRGPMLWVSNADSVLQKAGPIPVKYSGRLKDTFFQEAYESEFARSHLDNLNLLYVAFTRAEKGLFVLAPDPMTVAGMDKTKTVATLLQEGIKSSLLLASGWNESLNEWSSGEMPEKESSSTELSHSGTGLAAYESHRWREKLVIKQTGKGYFSNTPSSEDQREYGIHMHAILARIHFSTELDEAIQSMLADGLIDQTESQDIRKQVTDLWSNTLIASWFSNDWEVQTEVPLLLPGGGESRIDRLLVKDNKAVVIDFKTGTPAKADQTQVAEYMDHLKNMRFTEVEGYILYLRSDEVVAVPSGKPKAVKKKDKNQLGLDF